MGEWFNRSAYGPAILWGQKHYEFQPARRGRLLTQPPMSTVIRIPDNASITNGPSAFGVDKADAVQLGVMEQRIGLDIANKGLTNRNASEQRQNSDRTEAVHES